MKTTRAIFGEIREKPLVAGDEVFAVRVPGGFVFAWDEAAVFSALDGEVPMGELLVLDIEDVEDLTHEDELDGEIRGDLRRLGSSVADMLKVGIVPALDTLRKTSAGHPVFIRVAQFGGVGGNSGGVPGSSGSQAGGGQYGSSGGDVNFDNPLSRQQFDVSLDSIRKDPEKNGWFTSFETRLQNDKMLGHQRNEKDGNLLPYSLSFQERVNRKRKDQIRRMIENREKEKTAFDSNSIPALKATPPIERNYRTTEDKLKGRRQIPDPDPTVKRPQHGPESEFVHYPKPTRGAASVGRGVTAQVTIKRDGNDSIFKPEHADGDQIIDAKPRARTAPLSAKQSSPRGTESGLDGSGGRVGWYDTISQHYGEPTDYAGKHPDRPYADAGMRMNEMPPGMKDPVPEDRDDFGGERKNMFGGHPYSSIQSGPLLMSKEVQQAREQGNDQSLENDPPGPETFDNPAPFSDAGQEFIRRIREWNGTVPKQPSGSAGNLEKRMKKQHRNLTRAPQEEQGQFTDAPWPYAGSDTPGVGIPTGGGRLRQAHD